MINSFRIGLLSFVALSISACGDSKDGSAEGFGSENNRSGEPSASISNTSIKTQIEGDLATRFDNFIGRWVVEGRSNLSVSLSNGEMTSFDRSDIYAVNEYVVRDGQHAGFLESDCSLQAPTEKRLASIFNLDNQHENCSTSITVLNDDAFHYHATCEDDDGVDITYTRVSEDPVRDSGSFTLSSADFEDISASEGVCGQYIDAHTESFYEPELNQSGMADREYFGIKYTVIAPYSSGFVELAIDFSPSVVEPGVYTLAPLGHEVDTDNQISASVTFRDDDSNTRLIGVETGTLTIESIEGANISGSYAFNAYTGEFLEGTFSSNLSSNLEQD